MPAESRDSNGAYNSFMHELAIAEALIEQVGTELDRAGQKGAVKRLELAVGRLSGVHCDSLRFAFELLSPGTPAEGAELSIREPPRDFSLPPMWGLDRDRGHGDRLSPCAAARRS